MLEHVSLARGWRNAPYRAPAPFACSSTAVSAVAAGIWKKYSDVMRQEEGSGFLFGAKAAAISQLAQLAEECAAPDWNAEGADAVDPLAVETAEELIRVLPRDLPMPHIAVEPDGAISLDWIHSRHCQFSISAGSTDALAFAWLDGSEHGHGVAIFDRQSVPRRVLDGIRSVLSE